MATGVSGREKHGGDALTAARPSNIDPHPLPEQGDAVHLLYPNKLGEREVLAPLSCTFAALDEAGRTAPVDGITPNAFVLSDNVFALHHLLETGQRATLIYLDPPYGTGFEFHSRRLRHAYKDDQCAATYLELMRRRLILMREVMTEDGSLYLHIGHQMLFHVKIILDEVFGPKRFRSLILRRKCSSKNVTRNSYPNLHDYILFYTKSARYIWNQPCEVPEEAWILKEYPKTDARGRYKLVPVHAPGTRQGETGKQWRGKSPPPGKHWQYPPSRLDELDARGEMHWSRNGNPRRKVYLRQDKTLPLTDHWSGFRDAHHQSIRITGYPTEKNLDMLRMIVGASSNAGDLVVDPFCGSGTTLHAAQDLGRRWIGMDESFTAARATVNRIRHGLEAMGDYVRQRGEGEGAERGIRWEGTKSPLSASSVAGSLGAEFRFLVDAELLEQHGQELREIARL